MSAALEFELLKARRTAIFRWGAVAVVVGVPGLATVFFVLARSGGRSAAVAKATALVTDDSLAGLLGLTGQVLIVAMLLTAGIAASWSFGREFVDDAVPALFALATPRRALAAAKFWVLTGWAACTVVVAVVLTLLAGLGLGLPLQAYGCPPSHNCGPALGRAGLGAGPRRQLAPRLPGRPRRPARGRDRHPAADRDRRRRMVPLRRTVAWMGMGGVESAVHVSALQLILALAVAAVAVAATILWWEDAEAR